MSASVIHGKQLPGVTAESWKGLVWHRAEFAGDADAETTANGRSLQLALHADTVTRLGVIAFRSTNPGSVAVHVLSASRDGIVALCDVVVPPPPAPGSASTEPALVLERSRVVPEAPAIDRASSLTPLLLMWNTLQGQVGAKAKPTPVSAVACDSTQSVIFSASWDGYVFAHDAATSELLWYRQAHAGAIGSIAVIPLPRRLPPEERRDGSGSLRSDGSVPSEQHGEVYALVTTAWDGSVGACCVSLLRDSTTGAVTVRSCGADVQAPGVHGAAITAVTWCVASSADFDVLTADAEGVIVWLRVKARTALFLSGATPAVALTIDILTRTGDLVNPAIARRGADAMSGGVSGVTCLAVTAATTTLSPRIALPVGGLLVAATTVDGRLCLLAGAPPSATQPASLPVLATVATGEVLRCVAVDSAGSVLVTGGHHCRLRLWDVRRIAAACGSDLDAASQRDLCSSVVELTPIAANVSATSTVEVETASSSSLPIAANAAPTASSADDQPASRSGALDIVVDGAAVPPALAIRPWITACALVEADGLASELSSLESAPGGGATAVPGGCQADVSLPATTIAAGPGASGLLSAKTHSLSICLVAGTNSGHLVVWTSAPPASAAAAVALKNAAL